MLAGASPLHAQRPDLDWRTIKTQHFYVTFTPPIEGLARRIAADAERAYAELSREMHPPRGMIDVVISDDVDFSNGYATPFPTNRIVIYANPPVSESALRYTNDWGQLVITHELTHIFHLDRSRGIWSLGQHIFGRAATLFPNTYAPSWVTEGLAVYEESRLTGAGRIEGSEHRMIARAAAVDHQFPSVGALSLAQAQFPFGEFAYSYGSLFIDYLARTRGDSTVRSFVEKSSAELIPYLIDIPAKHSFGVSFSHAWHTFGDSVTRSVAGAPAQPIEGWRQLTNDGVFVFAPRWTGDSTIIYSGAPGRQSFGAYRVSLNGKRTRIGRRNSRSPNVPIAGGALLYAQTDYVNPYQIRSDLWIQRRGHERQITFGQRLTSPDARADGEIVAEQIVPGATRLVRVSKEGKRITPLTFGSYDEQWTEPRWSHAGDRIVASRWLHGNVSQIVVIDTLGRIVHAVSSGHSIEATPSWLPNDAGILYSSDRDGSAQVYAELFGDAPDYSAAVTYRLSSAATGLFEPTEAPDAKRTAAVLFRADGYHLGVAPCCTPAAAERVIAYREVTQASSTAPIVADSSAAHRYNAWRTFYPRYWLPTVDQGIEGGYRVGLMTSGYDVVGRHAMNATVEFPTNNTGVVGDLSYQYSGLGLPIVQLDASQEWESLGSAFSRDAQPKVLGAVRRRTWSGDVLATWLRQRTRTSLSLTGGVGVEHRTHVTTANVPLSSLDTTGLLGTPTFPSLIAGAGFANYQRPPYSISPEDGVQLNTTIRDRLRSGVGGKGPASLSAVGSASLYKSINLPGFAHHVLALRGAVGWADDRANGYFSVGGVSGSTFTIIPGYVIGEGRNTFPVRGFEDATLVGTRAMVGSVEYRIPLFLTGRAPGTLPFFLDRSSLTLFSDYGSAWCPNVKAGREVCNTGDSTLTAELDMASVGAELNLNLGVLSWDSPYRFRLGVAAPTFNRVLFNRPKYQVYVVSGISF